MITRVGPPAHPGDNVMSFIAHTDAERAHMLATIGISSTADLFVDLPASIRDPRLDLPAPLSELEALRALRALADRNQDLDRMPSFLGAGVYHHFIPSIVPYVLGRAEFATSYTPYQPEVSQGNLQAIYEYQSLVCALTGMEVANASVYDGATAMAEAAIMAVNVTQRPRVVVAPAVHPEYPATTRAYLSGQPVELVVASPRGPAGDWQPRLTPAAAAELLDSRTACLIVQQPNFFGCVEELATLAELAHAAGALLVVVAAPIALGILEAPGRQGADIVVGEGQPLGLAMSFGGPYLGLFACREQHIRQMPGRIVGATVDSRGRRGYVLTFQTREQHIRREKATSNICSNEALCALGAAVYLNWMGPRGLREVANACLQGAHYAARLLAGIPGYSLAFDAPYFHEFALRCPLPAAEVNRRLLAAGIVGGYDLGRVDPGLADVLLLCVTELNTRAEVEALATALARIGNTGEGGIG